MYTNHKSAQYVVSLLKKQGVLQVVISPGNSHNPIVRSIEEDGSFKTYCITDERSAAFFAIGLSQQQLKPIAILCTSGTAASNYLSGVTEAFRRQIPLVVITADKHPYYLHQMEDQMIHQPSIFEKVTKKSVTLPEIQDERDDWYCRRILNEAFLELNHHGTGPIHINVPISYGMHAIGDTFTTEELPDINIINRFDTLSDPACLSGLFHSLEGKRVLILCGQNYQFSQKETDLLDNVSKRYNCVLCVDVLSNLTLERSVKMTRLDSYFASTVPDIVITIDGNPVTSYKFPLKKTQVPFQHWHVTPTGQVADPFRKLTVVFEGNTEQFLSHMVQYGHTGASSEYFDYCKALETSFHIPDLAYSSPYACQQILTQLPENSLLNLGNSTTIRLAEYFDFHPSIKVYCNRGVNGIDGCMSTFVGQSACTQQLSFLLIGDLTFFYDMNALWNRYVSKNVRIALFNNSGASLFHFGQGLKNYPGLNENVAAEHFVSAQGWCESLGMKYLCARDIPSFETALQEFLSPTAEGPIIFEILTHKEEDALEWRSILNANALQQPIATRAVRKIKHIVKKIIS